MCILTSSANNLTFMIFFIYKIRNKLPYAILKQLYFAFVHSHISYTIEIYLNTCDSYFDKLTILNNKILSILQNKDLYFPVAQLYRNFNTLSPSKLHQQQIFILLQKSLYNSNQLPLVFGDYFVLNRSIHRLFTTPGIEAIFISTL